MSFEVKDSGVRHTFDSGMVRDVSDDKTDYTLVLDGPMFDRWAEHLTKGAKKYDARNWMKAQGKEEYARFRQSALRHFLQWFRGEQDEDHAAAVLFNINGAEYVSWREWMNEPFEEYPKVEVSEETTPFVFSEDFSKSAKVGDVEAHDILDVAMTQGGAQDLADDYNYLRRRVQELSSQLNRGVVDGFEADGGW